MPSHALAKYGTGVCARGVGRACSEVGRDSSLSSVSSDGLVGVPHPQPRGGRHPFQLLNRGWRRVVREF